jgi:glycosyltransferase involved in cell wall biosynthesis
VEPANPSELTDTIISILHDDRLRVKLSESSLKYAREISWRKVAEETLNVYRGLIK